MPYQTFCATSIMRKWLSMEAMPASILGVISSGALARTELRMPSACRSPRSTMMSMAREKS